MDENIRKLLDSELEADNLLGWELIEAKKVPFKDVMDYIENSKIPTHWEKKYRWDGNKFIKNSNLYGSITLGGALTTSGTLTYPMPYYGGYSTTYEENLTNEIQKEEGVDKSRTIWQNIKNAFKRK